MQQFQEGMTATGPGGAKIVFRGGAWQPLGGATSAPSAQRAPGIIYGQPDEPDQIDLARLSLSQSADNRADREEARAQVEAATDQELAALRIQRERLALSREQAKPADVNAQKNTLRGEGLTALAQQVDRVQQLYEQDFADQGLLTPLEYVPGLPANERFNSAGAGLGDQALAAFRVPGVGAQSDRELAAFVAANQPRAGDSDAAIQEKLSNLRRRIDAQRRALGQDQYSWRGAQQQNAASPNIRPQGAIEFGNTGGAPAGAEAYQAEVEAGIRNGTLKTADDVAAVAAKYRYAAPDRAETEKMFEALRNGARYGGAQAPQYASVVAQRAQMNRERGDSVVDPFVRGAADTVSLGLADEISGIGNAIITGGNVDENIALQRATDTFDEQRNFAPRLSGQIAGGFALPVPAAANTPGRLAAVGAGYGAGYGFGSADGGFADRLAGAAVGGAIGGGVGYAGGSLAQRLAGRGGGGGGGNPQGRATYQAAQEAGLVDEQGRVLALPADVGGPMTRRFTAGAAQSPFGAGPVTRAADRVNEAAAGRLGQIANAEGAPLRQEALGELGQNAAQGYIDRTGAQARRAYDAARRYAGDTHIQGQRAVSNIDTQLAELAATSNTDAPLIAGLQRLRSDLVDGEGASNLTIDAIRRLRTSTRAEAVADGLRGTDYNRRAGQVLDALSEDIASQLSPGAAMRFRNADRAYAERLNTIDDVMTQVIGQQGDRSAEAVANRLIQLGRGDSARLRSFLNAVEPEEAGIIRGSLIQEMGRASSGGQNAAGDAFSLQSFLTNWDKMPNRTRDLLFRGEHRQAIEALARYAEGARGARAYANTSNTAGASNAAGVARSAASGTLAVGTLGASAVLENLTGRLLGSRRFAQWLARAPREPGGVGAWARRLGVIATREPALAPDIAPLQAALSQAPGRAAAQDEKQ